MGCVYRRHQKLWIKFKGYTGKYEYQTTPYRVGQEPLAEKLLRRVEEKVAVGKVSGESGPVTVARYAAKWIKDCREMGIAEWKNNQGRLKLHVFPFILDSKPLGEMVLEDVRARHIAGLFKRLRVTSTLAPKTIRNIYSVVQGVFREAEIEGLIERSPCILTGHHLGELGDKDPEWRQTAIYTRAELEALITDPGVPEDRHVVYALAGIAALRYGEIAAVRVSHYERHHEPLGRLGIFRSNHRMRTKSGVPRYVPVHPVLADILDRWLREGWEKMMGRPPTPDDLLVPCPERPQFPAGRMRDKNYSRKRLIEDLVALEFRHRRGHDLRRTMISLARSDGARKDLLEDCTHTPKGGRTAIDDYTEFDWAALCDEFLKLKILWWKGSGSKP